MIKLSVIVPTRNRARDLKAALESIVFQTLPHELFEVIVVDNGSMDNTKEIVQGFENQIKNIVYIYDKNPGLHIGRHRGLLHAKAEILVYADDDIKALPTWLEGVIESFTDENIVLVGGKNLPNFETKPPQWIVDMWEAGRDKKVLGHLSILDFGDEIQEIEPHYVFGCNFSIRKHILLEAGGFHPDGMPQELIRYRGDGESYVSQYIFKNNLKTIYNPKASVYHLVSKGRMTKEYFVQRAFNQGISDSYTDIRNNIKRSFFKSKIRNFIKGYLLNKDVLIDNGYIKGYSYHQNKCKKDNDLVQWVKRASYINNGEIK